MSPAIFKASSFTDFWRSLTVDFISLDDVNALSNELCSSPISFFCCSTVIPASVKRVDSVSIVFCDSSREVSAVSNRFSKSAVFVAELSDEVFAVANCSFKLAISSFDFSTKVSACLNFVSKTVDVSLELCGETLGLAA